MGNEWIPTWERLPEKKCRCLITRCNPTAVTTAIFKNGRWWNEPLEEWSWPDSIVVAWMPLPEPFTGKRPLIIPDVDTRAAIARLREREKDLQRYLYLMERVWAVDVSRDESFQKVFTHFYRVRRNAEWREKYFSIFEEMKAKADEQIFYDEILHRIFEATGNVEASFSSKMLATIYPDMPIWDSLVLQNLQLTCPTSSGKRQMADVVDCYERIYDWYLKIEGKPKAKQWIKAFDRAFPEYAKISSAKKIDFILWANRSEDNETESE